MFTQQTIWRTIYVGITLLFVKVYITISRKCDVILWIHRGQIQHITLHIRNLDVGIMLIWHQFSHPISRFMYWLACEHEISAPYCLWFYFWPTHGRAKSQTQKAFLPFSGMYFGNCQSRHSQTCRWTAVHVLAKIWRMCVRNLTSGLKLPWIH